MYEFSSDRHFPQTERTTLVLEKTDEHVNYRCSIHRKFGMPESCCHLKGCDRVAEYSLTSKETGWPLLKNVEAPADMEPADVADLIWEEYFYGGKTHTEKFGVPHPCSLM